MDSEGKTITDSIMIHVQQSKEARNFNHRFTATFKLENKYEYDFVYSLDWQVRTPTDWDETTTVTFYFVFVYTAA